MFILSMKASPKRLFPVLLCLVLILAMLIAGLCFPTSRTMMTAAPVMGDSDEACATYLTSLGYETVLPAASVREITLPDRFDDTLTAYNELQKQAGFDLSGYAGQRVKYRTYALTDNTGDIHIYVYKDRIIGGDITIGGNAMPLISSGSDDNGTP